MADRLPWTFDPTKPEFREAKAQEYCAYYLDRIDQTLERIATALEKGGGNELLRLQLMSIEAAILKTAGMGPGA
jgi:hypothetical protein